MKPLLRHLLVAAAAVALAISVRVALTGADDLGDLVRFREWTGSSIGPGSAFFASGLDGDGQVFAVMALDPKGDDIGHLLGAPSYRYTRILYPWTSAAVVLGTERLLLLGLAVVGWIGVAVTALVASVLSDLRGRWAWVLLANPALFLAAAGDTAEPMAIAILSLSLLTGSALLAWSLALVRPSYLVAITGKWLPLVAGVVTAIATNAYWSRHFDEPFLTGPPVITWPLGGILAAPSALGWVLVAGAVITGVIGVQHRDLAWMMGAGFVLCFGAIVFGDPRNAVRAAGYLPVLWAFGPGFGSAIGWRGFLQRLGFGSVAAGTP